MRVLLATWRRGVEGRRRKVTPSPGIGLFRELLPRRKRGAIISALYTRVADPDSNDYTG